MKSEIISQKTAGLENGYSVVELGTEESPTNGSPTTRSGFEADTEDSKDEKPKEPELQPVPYLQLFRYATAGERALTLAGLVLGVCTSAGLPFIIILYGEYTTLLVERHMAANASGADANASASGNAVPSRTPTLNLFGGGRPLVEGSEEERRAAMMEDASAFGLGALAGAVLQAAFAIACIACLNASAHRQVGRVRRMFLRSLLCQEMAWFDMRDPAALASRLSEDLDKLQDGIGEKLGMFTFLLVSFVGSVAMSFAHGWKLTLAVLTCAPVIVAATALVARVQSSLAAREQEAYGTAAAAAAEALGAVRTVAAFEGQDKEAERYAERLRPAEAAGCRRGLFSGLGSGVMWFIIYSSYSLAFWYGVELILQARADGSDEYTPAVLVIVLFGVLAGAMNMGLASPHLEAFAVARGAAAAVFAVLERPPRVDALAEGGRRPAQPPRGELELRDVHFRYPSRPGAAVLRGLRLRVRPGETVALVGRSGCGKSTVVQLLQRLYDPDQGQVLLDGEDVRELNVAWLRAQLGVVGQEPVLFAVSVGDNIRLGREDASQADVEAAAKAAGAHDFIARLPQGYETVVGERGAQLSGGQKQRVAIARALVRDPRILLLDEATSALDATSQALVQAALERASKGRTTVLVAHRLSTVAAADRIVVLAEGRVAEEGTHAELMARRGHYYALVATAADDAGGDADPALQTTADARQDALGAEEAAGAGEARPDVLAKRMSLPAVRLDESLFQNQRKPSKAAEADGAGAGEGWEEEAAAGASLWRILLLNRPEWLHIAGGCLAAAVVGAALPFFAVLFGEVYKALSLEEPEAVRGATRVFAGLFVVVGVMAGVGTYAQLHLFAVAGARLTSRLRLLAFRALLSQDAAFFDEPRHAVGVLCARLSADAAAVQGATGSRLGALLQALCTLLIGAALALSCSWKLTLVALLGVPLVFAGVFLEARLLRAQGLHEKKALESAAKVAAEAVGAVRTVAALGAERAVLRRYCEALATAEAAARRKARWRGPVFALGQSSVFPSYALAFYYGGYLAAYEGLPYENIIKVSEALLFGAWMLGQTMALAPSFSAAQLSARRLFALLDRRPAIPADTDAKELPQAEAQRGRVAFEGVHFRYPSRPGLSVLRGLQLEVPAGATVALVGPSGCGKSTCLQLLQRHYDPLQGAVVVGGRATTAQGLRGLRAQLGVVAQEPALFDRSVADNIAYGDNSRAVPMQEIVAAARAANIHDFVSALPQGYDTRLGANAAQLSGGQRQRVAIARALVRDPRILLLDEATSALDAQSEKAVQAALEAARCGRTCVVVAHRLATVQHASLICVLSQGAVAEMGTHAQLLDKKGLYYSMHQRDATH